ncbi:MAG: pantoate--beta-alanine ligase [Bacteroidales bacterium]|nr:pantoate--beta-alanine ligase [Bacteroidales bacterium]
METIYTIAELQKKIISGKAAGKKVGLVPTMGALHSGHISLVKRCVNENDICVVSVFVNPTQFNDKDDLINYPRTPQEDKKLLENAGCTYVFMPSIEEMYPEPDTRIFNFGTLETVMEGGFRPGHFNGVAQIVSKLFYAVLPDCAYFGQKDFQQISIIREMVKQLGLQIEIKSCPIVREADGLAMSSRNRRLTPEQREKAPQIAQFLFKSLAFVPEKSIQETLEFVKTNLSSDSIFKLDYFEIVDGYTLQPVSDWKDSNDIVGCVAVYCGPIRLIDNIVYKQHAD